MILPVLVLASSSPRRAELLSQVGLAYHVVCPDLDESVGENELPVDYVARMSMQKAAFVVDLLQSEKAHDDPVILAADTIVVVDGDILGKPEDESDAISMLRRLSAGTHQVVTSVSVQAENRHESIQVETNVQFRTLSHEECKRYWMTGEPRDKAGAYAIQGIAAIFVEKLNGSYSNVVGLPLNEAVALLREFGIECLPQGLELKSEKEMIQHG